MTAVSAPASRRPALGNLNVANARFAARAPIRHISRFAHGSPPDAAMPRSFISVALVGPLLPLSAVGPSPTMCRSIVTEARALSRQRSRPDAIATARRCNRRGIRWIILRMPVPDRAWWPQVYPRLRSLPAARVKSPGHGTSKSRALAHRVSHRFAYDPPAGVLDEGATSATEQGHTMGRGPRPDQATARAHTAAARARMPRSTSAADTASSG